MYRRRRTRLAFAAVVVLALVVGAVAWYQSQLGGPGGAQVVVTVAPGSSMGAVTGSLVRDHVVDNSLAFRVYLTLHGTPTVQPGQLPPAPPRLLRAMSGPSWRRGPTSSP